jgi:outer membrane receptor protein involved in Fe transport
MKNTLLGGSLNVNLTGFYYDYTGYQIAEYVAQSAVNTNVNAKIYGVEFETVYSPIHNFTLNANVGYLHSALNGGQSLVDPLNLTQGNAGYTVVKSGGVGGVALGQNCLAPTAAVAGYISGGYPAAGLSSQCALSGANEFGLPANLGGKKLPNTPPVTVSVGAQYVFELPGDWRATLRGDYYWQDDSFARVFNAVNDRLQSYHVVNATLTFANLGAGVDLQVYVKNAFNAQPITGTYVSDPSTGLFTNVFTLDPRTYGAQLTKRF